MQTTENYGLYLTDDSNEHFLDWRLQMNGLDDSNMVKIDQALAMKADQPEKYAVTLEAALWTGDTAPYSYAITFENHNNTTDLVELMVGDDMTVEQVVAMQSANIVYAEWTTNTTLILYAYGTKPTVDVPVNVVIR